MRVLPKRRTLTKGDYVLATKFSDGDPLDNWAVGFFSHMTDHSKPRYMVIDNTGVQLRPNGFRRAEKIKPELGEWLLSHVYEIENSRRSVWSYKYKNRYTLSS